MSQAWSAEIVVCESLARSLIEEQFPQLAPVRLELQGGRRRWATSPTSAERPA